MVDALGVTGVEGSFRKAAEITIESAFDGVGELPLHSGAAKYYQEIGAIDAE